MILIGLLYLIFSAMTFINSKLMLTNPYPFFVGMLRAVCSGIFLLSYSWFKYKKELIHFSLPKTGWKDLIAFSILVHGFAMCGFSYGIQYTDPIKICFMFATCPFVTMILEYFLHAETLTPKKIVGLAIGLLGLIPVLLDVNHGAYKDIPFHLEVLGALVTFASIVFFAYGWIVMKRFLKMFQNHSIEIVNGIAMLLGGCVSFLLLLIFTQGSSFTMTFTEEFPVLIVAFVVSSLITYMIYPYLLKTYSATFIAFAGFLEPAFALLFGMVFMGNKLTALSCLSLIILFIGLYIFYKEETRTHGGNIKNNPDL